VFQKGFPQITSQPKENKIKKLHLKNTKKKPGLIKEEILGVNKIILFFEKKRAGKYFARKRKEINFFLFFFSKVQLV
jgi:hypothetical protein